MDKTEQSKKAMLQALEKSLGVVTVASKAAGIGRTTHYMWMKEDPEYRKAVDELEDVALDFAESKLHSQIKDNNTLEGTIDSGGTEGKIKITFRRVDVEQNFKWEKEAT